MTRFWRVFAVATFALVSATALYSQCCDANWCADCAASGGLCRPATCGCFFNTPIIIDVSGNGFQLTNITNGVHFQFGATESPVQTAWTSPTSDDAFLFLDRNGNGMVDNGTELFGNDTPQPLVSNPNGYNALSVYDKPENGGNGDGQIDSRDAIFSSLRLWRDVNHDGQSQPSELFTLPALGIYSISLHYHQSMREDQFHNTFRYCSAVNGGDSDRACDVYFGDGKTTTKGEISK